MTEWFEHFSWANGIEYEGHQLNVLECVEVMKKTGKKTSFTWITNMEVNHSNYSSIAKGGRLKMTIENHRV